MRLSISVISVGDDCLIHGNLVPETDSSRISIGIKVFIGGDFLFYCVSSIVIEDDVQISFCVTILKGVRIGVGSIIAANSLVAKDIPPHVVYRNDIVPVITPYSRLEKL